MSDVALGTKVFKRSGKLRQLLKSVPEDAISQVYVADDGETSDRADIYNRSWPFRLNVFNLDYDAGIGAGRSKIVNNLEEDYLLLVDSDHTIPGNVTTLRRQLEQLPDVGGIAGSIIEPKHGRIWQSGKNLYEKNGGLIRDASGNREIESIAGFYFIRFDFIPNAALFRKQCLEDYCWDPNIVLGSDHIDFYVGHWKTTDWDFGVSPSVHFGHYPGGDDGYESTRYNNKKIRENREYFLEKWGFDFDRTDDPYYFDTNVYDSLGIEDVKSVWAEEGTVALIKKGMKRGFRSLK